MTGLEVFFILAVIGIAGVAAAVGLGWVEGAWSVKIIPPSKRPKRDPADSAAAAPPAGEP